jgi:hypothetical protein
MIFTLMITTLFSSAPSRSIQGTSGVLHPITLNHVDRTFLLLFHIHAMQQVAFTEAAPLVISSCSHLACFQAHTGSGYACFLFSGPCSNQSWHPVPQAEGHILLSYMIFSLSSGPKSSKMPHLWGRYTSVHIRDPANQHFTYPLSYLLEPRQPPLRAADPSVATALDT